MSSRSGALLLEVLVALAIAALAGAAALQVGHGALDAAAAMAQREQELQRADRLLALYALATRTELDQRIGQQALPGFVMRVQRPDPLLYRLSVAAADRPDAELLVTVVFRPELLQ